MRLNTDLLLYEINLPDNNLHQCPLVCGTPLLCHPPLSFPMLTPFPHTTSLPLPPSLYPHCGSMHTWPSQIRALENQRAERKAGCMAEQGERGGEGRLVDGIFQHSDGAKS